jgi:hypothetical protein
MSFIVRIPEKVRISTRRRRFATRDNRARTTELLMKIELVVMNGSAAESASESAIDKRLTVDRQPKRMPNRSCINRSHVAMADSDEPRRFWRKAVGRLYHWPTAPRAARSRGAAPEAPERERERERERLAVPAVRRDRLQSTWGRRRSVTVAVLSPMSRHSFSVDCGPTWGSATCGREDRSGSHSRDASCTT